MTAPRPVITARRERSDEGTAHLSGRGSGEEDRRDCSEGGVHGPGGRKASRPTMVADARRAADGACTRGGGHGRVQRARPGGAARRQGRRAGGAWPGGGGPPAAVH